MKLKTAITYRLKYQLQSGSFFFGYFLLFCIFFPIIGMIINGSKTLITSDALLPSCIFLIILAFIGIKSDFKLFIQNSMARFNIFLANIISNFLLVFCMTCAVFFVKYIINLLTTNFKITIFFMDLYAENSSTEAFFLLLVILLVASSIGTLIGICRDCLSSFMQLAILGFLTVIPTLLILLIKLISPENLVKCLDFFKHMLGITDKGFHFLPLIITLIVCYLVFTAITYLLNRYREIKRIDG